MDVNNKLLLKTHKSFRFGTGLVLTLTDHQINRIPFLAAIASSADFFEAARDDQGCFRLHPKINIKQFRFILDWSPFSFMRDIFIHLPEDYDPVSTIVLMNYLGLLDVPDPTLDDVEDSFFDIIVYKPLKNSYVERLRPLQMCDMAVRFAIALIREAYDITDDGLHDRIYWYVMFILSVHEIFVSNIRHHVYKVAEHYFCLFKPSLIERLDRLRTIQEENRNTNLSNMNRRFIDSNNEEEKSFVSLLDTHVNEPLSSYVWLSNRSLFSNLGSYEDLFQWKCRITTETLLEPLYKALVEIIYDRLQNRICQSVRDDVREAPFSSQSLDEPWGESSWSIWSSLFHVFSSHGYMNETIKAQRIAREIIEERRISDLFANEISTEEIQHLILQAISHLKPKLEKEHHRLVQEIQTLQTNQDATPAENILDQWLRLYPSELGRKQEDALTCELLLDKLNQFSNIIEQIRGHLLTKLLEAAKCQILSWVSNALLVFEIGKSISQPIPEPDDLVSKLLRRNHRKPMYRPMPTKHPKFSRRRFH